LNLDQDEFIDDIPFPETQNYVKRILGTMDDYRSLYGRGDAGLAAVPKPAPAPKPSVSEAPVPVRKAAAPKPKAPVKKKAAGPKKARGARK
jgi:soluble lytic murein transglycosylase